MATYFADGGMWRRIAEDGRLIVFERADGGGKDEREIRMCGVFDDEGQLAMVFNMIQMGKLDGSLHVSNADKQIVLYFRQGNYLSGRSNIATDRIGEILLGDGHISRQQLEAALAESDDQNNFGKILVKKGIMKTQDVYAALQKQAERIVASCLRFGSGTYALISPLDMTEVPAMLHLDTQSLLLDALRVIDEERAHPPEFVEPPTGAGIVPQKPKEGLSDEGAKNLIATYNEALKRLFAAVPGDTKLRMLEEGTTLLHDSAAPYHSIFEGVAMDRQGTLDRLQLLANLASDPDSGSEHLQVGLSELLFFILFAAGDAVEERAKRSLHRDVAEAMRGLHG